MSERELTVKRIIQVLSLVAVVAAAGTPAISQTVLTDVWKDKAPRGKATKIAVFWMAPAPQNRLLAENEFVRQLKERGNIAMPAYVVIPPDKFVERDAAVAKIKGLGVDVLLTLRAIDKKTAQTSVPEPGSPDRARLSGYYSMVYDAPSRDASDTAYVEANLFDVSTEQRIWTARSVTKVSVTDQQALAGLVTSLIDRLASDGLILK